MRRLILQGWMIVLLALCGNSLAAQNSEMSQLPPCETNVGSDGEMLEGFDGMIYAPVAFDQVKMEGGGLTVIAGLRDGLGVLARSGFLPTKKGDQPPPEVLNERGEPIVRLEFIAGTDRVVHVCHVHLVAFDPARHDMAKLQRGNCDLKLVAGMAELRVGHVQAWQMPGDSEGNFVAPKTVMDLMTLDYGLVMPSGNAPGVALMGWTQKQQDGTQRTSLCPFEVMAAQEPIDDKYLCKDVQGKPLRLAVGAVATVMPLNADGTAFETNQYMLQDPTIAKATGFDKANHGPIVQGVRAGSTSVALLSGFSGKIVAAVCEVVVE